MTVPASSGAIDTATSLRDAAGSQSRAAGSIIDTLDSLALTIGETRISLWDSIVIAGVILFGIMLAWSTSKVCGSLLRRMTRLDDTQRSEERRVGQGWVRQGKSRWLSEH